MTSNPPPYAPEETKGLYPSVPGDPQQQMQMQPQQQPGVYYLPQGSPAAPGAPGVATVTYYPSGPGQQQQPQQLVISQPAPVVVATQQQTPSLICHIALSCFVAWCCCFPCGLLAFILAGEKIQISLIMVIRDI